MHTVTLDEAKAQLADLVEVASSGETVIITKDGAQFQLVLIAHYPRRPQFGSAHGLIQMSDDFDAPRSDFDEYMR